MVSIYHNLKLFYLFEQYNQVIHESDTVHRQQMQSLFLRKIKVGKLVEHQSLMLNFNSDVVHN